jgi:hypothetical protein
MLEAESEAKKNRIENPTPLTPWVSGDHFKSSRTGAIVVAGNGACVTGRGALPATSALIQIIAYLVCSRWNELKLQ